MTQTDALMTTRDTSALPGISELGDHGVWVLPTDANGATTEFEGYFIGVSSSRKQEHENHEGSPFGVSRTWTSTSRRCGACRWFEPRIFVLGGVEVLSQNGRGRMYGLYKLGATIVPGEINRMSFERATSSITCPAKLNGRSRSQLGRPP